tara:strand:- start:65 stop:1144 length:1080 start_codon:yes stop_codon:yes gene_type:complete
MANKLMDKIMGALKDDKGLFQGGQEGRIFGRAKDALEGKKGTIGHNVAMSLSGVSKEGDDSWQRSLDYEDLPEITKREGGIRGKFRDIFGLDNKLGDYDQLTKDLRGAGSDYSYNQAITDHDRRRAEMHSEYNQGRLKHAVETGDIATRNEMLIDSMNEQNILNWAINDGDLPQSVKDRGMSNADLGFYKKHIANDPNRFANPTSMKASDKGFSSGRQGWDDLNMKDFGFDVSQFKEGNLDELKGLYESLDSAGRQTLMENLGVQGQRYGYLNEGESPSDYAKRMFKWGVDYTGAEAGKGFADSASEGIGMILNNQSYDDGYTPDVNQLVWQTNKAGYTQEGKAEFEERMRRNIEDAGY